MTEPDEQIRRRFQALAAQYGRPADPPTEIVGKVRRRRRAKRFALAVPGTAAVAALAVIAPTIAGRPASSPHTGQTSSSTRLATSPPQSTPAPSRHTRPASSPTRLATSPPRSTRIIDAPAYAVSYRVPADWTATPYQGKGQGVAEDGESGFVVMDATGAPGSSLQTVCHGVANDNVLHPYGTSPTTQITTIAGRTGCYVWPSADAPAEPARRGGPDFQSAAALIPYLQPISNSGTFQYLLITADPGHIQPIAGSVVFHAAH